MASFPVNIYSQLSEFYITLSLIEPDGSCKNLPKSTKCDPIDNWSYVKINILLSGAQNLFRSEYLGPIEQAISETLANTQGLFLTVEYSHNEVDPNAELVLRFPSKMVDNGKDINAYLSGRIIKTTPFGPEITVQNAFIDGHYNRAPNGSGLSIGMIVLIVVLCLAVFGGVFAAIWYKRKRDGLVYAPIPRF